MCIGHNLLILLLVSICELSSFGLLSENILRQSSNKHTYAFLLGLYLRVELLGLRRCTAKQFSKVVVSDIFLCEKKNEAVFDKALESWVFGNLQLNAFLTNRAFLVF